MSIRITWRRRRRKRQILWARINCTSTSISTSTSWHWLNLQYTINVQCSHVCINSLCDIQIHIYTNNRQRTVNVFTKISINRVLNEQKKQYEQLKRTCILCSILWFDTSTKPTKVTNTIMKPVESYRWPDTPATKKTVQQKINRNWGLGEWEQVKRKFPLVLKYAQSILAGGIVRLEMVLHYRHSMSAGLNLYLF